MTMTRQQRRKLERELVKKASDLNAYRKANPMAEAVHYQGYEEGWKAACDFCMKVCYASSVKALHDLEGYGAKRNTRFLRKMDWYVTNAMTSEEAIEEAFSNGGVAISFREPFEEDRVQEVKKK
jgi:hypothetical protein